MAHTEHIDIDRWVDARLAALAPADDWQPNSAVRLADVHARRAAGASRRLRWTAAAGAVTILGASLPGTRALGARCLEACVVATSRAAQIWRADEPEATQPSTVGAAVGNLAPDLLGTDVHGTPVRLSEFRGHVVVVNFWATWCPPCKAEIPRLNELRTQYGPEGLEIVGVSVDEDGWTAINAFAGEQQIAYTLALANDQVTSAYGGVTALPMTFVIDRAGRIVHKIVGPILPEHEDPLQIGKLFGQ